MPAIYTDFLSGTLSADMPVSGGAPSTTMSSAGLADVPAITGGGADFMRVVLNPFGLFGNRPEIVSVTAHTAAATSATVSRAQGGTSAQNHPAGTQWIVAPLSLDWDDFTEKISHFFTTELFTAAGQLPVADGSDSVDNLAAPTATGQALVANTALGMKMEWGSNPHVCTLATRPTGSARWVGRHIFESDTLHTLVWDGTAWRYVDTPPGTIVAFADEVAPPGWELCYGQERDGALDKYKALFAVIGTTFGAGASGSLFKMPDLAYRMIGGWGMDHPDETDWSQNEEPLRLKAPGAIGFGDASGKSNYVLTENYIPEHQHTIQSSGSHTHSATAAAAGSHDHGGQVSSGGQHTHRAWASHTSTGGSSGHTHGVTGRVAEGVSGGGTASRDYDTGPPIGIGPLQPDGTSTAHVHAISTAATHTHDVTVTGGGSHTHSTAVFGAAAPDKLFIEPPHLRLSWIIRL